ncbi:MAG: hypothetical protein BGN88_08995 [Clostridiales bacterium 43-6]|nr:MAG: hypothetical protein BGN88_08995 [Clostridiales bacterium 43-6]
MGPFNEKPNREGRQSKIIKQKMGAKSSTYIKDSAAPVKPAALKDLGTETPEEKRSGSKHVKEGKEIAYAFPLAMFVSKVRSDLAAQVRTSFSRTVIFFVIFGILLAGQIALLSVARIQYNKDYKINMTLEANKRELENSIKEKNTKFFEDIISNEMKLDTSGKSGVNTWQKVSLRYYYYTISMNGGFIKDATVNTTQPKVVITITEKFTKNAREILPLSVLNIGSVFSKSDAEIAKQFKEESTLVKPVIEKVKNEDGYTYKITFDGLKKGDITTMFFARDFQEKLALPDSKVEIFYS